MDRHEYEHLQQLLSFKRQNNPYSPHVNPRICAEKKREGYDEGILAAKSILHAHYTLSHKEGFWDGVKE